MPPCAPFPAMAPTLQTCCPLVFMVFRTQHIAGRQQLTKAMTVQLLSRVVSQKYLASGNSFGVDITEPNTVLPLETSCQAHAVEWSEAIPDSLSFISCQVLSLMGCPITVRPTNFRSGTRAWDGILPQAGDCLVLTEGQYFVCV